jgi:predicted dehydrogenase
MAVRVGLVGAGRRAHGIHAPSLARSPDVDFVGIWGRSPRMVEELATKYGVTAFDRFEDLLASCDAVDFAVPPTVQAEFAEAAAWRHKPILVEAPIAGDLAGAERLAAAVTAGGAVSALALTWRYAAAVRQFLTAEVPRTHPQGGTGKLMSSAFADGSTAAPWRKERGVLLMLGPHLIDMLDAALGPVADVRAHGDPQGWVGLQLEHAGGRFSDVSMSGTVEVEHDRADIEIFGPGGTAAIDCVGAVGPETFETMFSEFAACVTEGRSHELDIERGLHLQRVVEAAETDLLRREPSALGGGR